MEEWLNEFKPVAPRPALKAQVLAAARNTPRPGVLDRLWTRRTWMTIAAGTLAAVGLYALSLRPIRIDLNAAEDAMWRIRELEPKFTVWVKGSPRVMVARLDGPNALRLEDLK